MPEKDPYQVLGVSRDATEEQVKAAYRELAKKYHPDNYADSPLADVANEKMQEVNAAYDAILKDIKNRGSSSSSSSSSQGGYNGNYQGGYQGGYRQQNTGYGGYGGYGGFGGQGYGYGQAYGAFADVRRMIQQNRLVEAEELLDGTPSGRRDGEWHFLRQGGAGRPQPDELAGTRRLRCARHRIPADGRLWQRNGCLQLLRQPAARRLLLRMYGRRPDPLLLSEAVTKWVTTNTTAVKWPWAELWRRFQSS